MTPAQLDHLKLIDAHLAKPVDIAAKRTPGEWCTNQDRNWETFSVEADDTICDFFYLSEETHHRHPFQEGNEENNAAFIASCAGNAEAGWRATRAVIQTLLNCNPATGTGSPSSLLLESVLAAFPNV